MELDNTTAVEEMLETAETREIPEETPPTPTDMPSEDLLMYLAKQNVKKRQNLTLNIILFPVVFIVLAIITGGFSNRGGLSGGFYAGIFFSWGMIILYRFASIIHAWLISKSSTKKRDPVEVEYERLKNSSPGTIKM